MGAVFLALGAAAGWGSADFLAGRASRVTPASVVLSLSQLIGLIGAIAALALWRPALPTGTHLLAASLSGVFLAIGLGALYEAMRVGSISLVAPISGTAAVVPFGYGLASGEDLSALQFGGLALAFTGVLLASADRRSARSLGIASGVGFALLAALSGGINIIFLDRASEGGVLWTIAVQRFTICLLGFAVVVLYGRAPDLRSTLSRSILAIGVLDVVGTASFAAATTEGRLSIVSVLGALFPVATVLLAYTVLHERLSRLQQVGVACAITAVAIVVASNGA
jgi:drug/metabolite transporter (DMT)-like permease